jgi:two-component system phosphate regulon response regulator PhoB
MRIFVIDDDKMWEDYYRRVLRGFDLDFFHDGVAAISEMDEKRPDAIVLDILLTGPTGFAVLKEMRSYSELADVPVVIVSSVEIRAELADDYGVAAILDKSTMTPKGFRAKIEEALNAA